MSAWLCGCDPECGHGWCCRNYPNCDYGRGVTNKPTEPALIYKDTMSELTDVGAGDKDNGSPSYDLTMNQYQERLHTYKPGNYSCHALGLVGELGEVLSELMGALECVSVYGLDTNQRNNVAMAFRAAARVADMVKKQEHHGCDKANAEAIKKELGDVLWYITAVAGDYGLTLQQVAEANITKLRARYPNGFEKDGGKRDEPLPTLAQGKALGLKDAGANAPAAPVVFKSKVYYAGELSNDYRRVCTRLQHAGALVGPQQAQDVRAEGEDAAFDDPTPGGTGDTQASTHCCRIPPSGWHCTCGAGHLGACAAVPTTQPAPGTAEQVSRAIDEKRYAHAVAFIEKAYRAGERSIFVNYATFCVYRAGGAQLTRWTTQTAEQPDDRRMLPSLPYRDAHVYPAI